MGAFRYDNPLIVFMVRLANMMIVSLYWILCCIPVITILPASAALYHSVVHVVMGRGNGLTKDFFSAFRAACRPGILLTMVVELVGALVCFGIYTGLAIWDTGVFGAAYMALGVLIGIACSTMLIYVPPVLSRFEGGMGVILRLALYFSGKRLLVSAWYVLLLAMGVWFVDFFPLALVVMPALYTDLIRGGMEKVMKQYIADAGLEDAEEEQPAAELTDDTPTAMELDRMLTEDTHG